MMMAIGTWEVVSRCEHVGIKLTKVGEPQYVPEEIDQPPYDLLIKQITDYAMTRPQVTRISRCFFLPDEEMDKLRAQLIRTDPDGATPAV